MRRWHPARRCPYGKGGVHSSTAAALPFLFSLAQAPETPDRADMVRFLVSVGQAVIEQAERGAEDRPGVGAVLRAYAAAAATERIVRPGGVDEDEELLRSCLSLADRLS